MWFPPADMCGQVGGHIDIASGSWTQKEAGVGTSIDSYFEYLLKSHLAFGDVEFLQMFQQVFLVRC